MIDELTPEQEAKFPLYVEKWLKIGLDTKPLDFNKAEAAVRKCYDVANAHQPAVVFVKSPAQALKAWAIVKTINDLYGDDADQLLIDRKINSVVDTMFHLFEGKEIRSTEVRKDIDNVFSNILGDNRTFKESPAEILIGNLGVSRDQISNFIYGQHDAFWLSFYDFFRIECGLVEETKELEGLTALAYQAGWCLPYDDICFVCSKPYVVNRDDHNRLHCTSEAALAYTDGLEIYSIHGVRVREEIIKHPEKITVEDIENEKNAEVRRVMMGLYGEDRYLKDSGCILVSKDQYGELYRKAVKDDNEPFSMIRVVNSTPEPDGTNKIYFLQVPPTMNTAHEAVAWTFRKTVEDYHPDVET